MANSDVALRRMAEAIVAGDAAGFSRLLAASPELATASFEAGASRESAQPFYIDRIGRYIYGGDTALHIAAAAYHAEFVRQLIGAGADVHAKNRMGAEPLHAAANAHPGSRWWDPAAQGSAIVSLIEAGADPNAVDKRGVTPLHIAVRTRGADAVRTLLENGADPARKNKSGSTPLVLAKYTTGRGGSGSKEAKAEQSEIVRLLGG